jgi:hypothetical protein
MAELEGTSQEVVSPEAAERIRRYQDAMEQWRVEDRAWRDGARFLAILAFPLLIVSFLAAHLSDRSNDGVWLALCSVGTGAAATVCALLAVAATAARIHSAPPVQPSRGP